ncbi:MAG TPA: protein kinase, partial [Gemmatales bacterium]|nr:protein kinase [Gemmatales bacterium]
MMRHPNAEPADLANFLVEQSVLTRFQADSLLNGKSQGLVLGPFIVHDVLGSGTMGTVYQSLSKIDNKWYAVKVLPRRSMWNIRLARRKVRDFEQFQHPAVVPFVDVGTSGAMHYLAWPLVDGEQLNRIMEREGQLNWEQTALYTMLTAEGLEACHQRNILHGLLKPSNIMITPEHRVKILDFGVGSLLRETEGESVVDTMSTANTLAAGLDCASPESIMDPTSTSFASDQYSLGCIMYYCLTGQYPFPGNNAVEKMMAHQTKTATPIKDLAPDTPDEIVAVVERLMQKRVEDRYASISDVVVTLRPMVMVPSVAPQVGPSGARLSGMRPVPDALRRSGASPAAPSDSRARGPKVEVPSGPATPASGSPLRQSGARPTIPETGSRARGPAAPPITPSSFNSRDSGSTVKMSSREQGVYADPHASATLKSGDVHPVYHQPVMQQQQGVSAMFVIVAMFLSMAIGMGAMFAFLFFFMQK